MSWHELRIAIIGPLPPPAGGMGDQVAQLSALLGREGAEVKIVRTNADYHPHWIAAIRVVRAFARLLPYVRSLWRHARHADVFHVMANSGWAWHLCAAPAIWVAKLRGIPCIVSYHGGEAETFLARSVRLVAPTLLCAQALIVPSTFLQRVFGRYGIDSRIVPNVVDLSLFKPGADRHANAPHLIVARNLEPVYDVPTALRAFVGIRERFPDAILSIAGSGSELDALSRLADELGIRQSVCFTGRLSREQMATLMAGADLMLNPSTADNLPVSILEAMASGVPVVSTSVGGIPYFLDDGRSALLVKARDATAMRDAALRVLLDLAFAAKIRAAAEMDVQQYSWAHVRVSLEAVYGDVLKRQSPRPA